MEHRSICVAGSINVDLVAYLDGAESAAGYAIGGGFQMSAGGKSLNAAMTIAALTPVDLVGRVGDDRFGAFIIETLGKAGVGTRGINVDASAGTGVGHVRVSTEGEYDTVVVAGANDRFAPADIDAYLQDSEVPGIAVLNLEVPLDTVRYAARTFRDGGSTVVLNASPVHPEARTLLELTDVVVLNAEEARLILTLPGEDDVEILLEGLRAAGARSAVITLGPDGAAFVDDNGQIGRVNGVPAVVVNTIGAGDTFLGALVAMTAAGHPLDAALTVADEAGRIVCSKASSHLTVDDALAVGPDLHSLIPLPTTSSAHTKEPSHG